MTPEDPFAPDAQDSPPEPPPPAPDPKPAKARGARKRAAKKATGTAKKVAAAAPRREAAPKPPGKPSNKAKRAEAMAGVYMTMGMGCTMSGSITGSAALIADGQLINECAPGIGEAWAELAEVNDYVRKVCDTLTQSSAWGGLIVAHVPLYSGLVANHARPQLSVVPDRPADPFAPGGVIAEGAAEWERRLAEEAAAEAAYRGFDPVAQTVPDPEPPA